MSKKERNDNVEWSIIVKNIVDIKDLKESRGKEKTFSEVHIELSASDAVGKVQKLKDVISNLTGKADLFIHIEKDASSYVVKASDEYKVVESKKSIDELLELPFVLNAWGE